MMYTRNRHNRDIYFIRENTRIVMKSFIERVIQMENESKIKGTFQNIELMESI